jgi:hypothetical protein
MQEVPRTRALSTYDEDWKEYIRSERGITVDRKHEELVKQEQSSLKNFLSFYKVWQGRRHQGVAEYYCTVLERIGKDYKLMLFFSGMECLFVQEYQNNRFISRTYYEGREYAMQQYKNNTIGWIHKEQIS